ncbi:MAG TPA: hypothetical protein VL133_01960, partial [Devosia sp.]|nr:hypothetical protein [Devosia sp.]
PEMDELGLAKVQDSLGFSIVNRTVLIAPPGLPEDIRAKLEAAMEKVMAQPALIKQVADLGYVAQFKPGAETQAETAEVFAEYGTIIDEILSNQK